MNCPECNADTRVVDSRGVRRRRVCKVCGCRFSTEEVLTVIGRKKVKPEPSQSVAAPPPPKPKPEKKKKFSVQKAASARRRLEDMRDLSYLDDDFDYIPEKW